MMHFQLFPSHFSEMTAGIEHCLRGDCLFSPWRSVGFSWQSMCSVRIFSINEDVVLFSSLPIALSFLRVSSSVRNDIFVFFRVVGISRWFMPHQFGLQLNKRKNFNENVLYFHISDCFSIINFLL